MAKIALALKRALERRRALGECGCTTARVLARGDGWRVADVVCTSGPLDRPFEEQHTEYSIAVVLAGSFQYSAPAGRTLMTPGSIMLGNPGQCFECGHEHAEGDRCVSFWYRSDYLQRLTADAGHKACRTFAMPRIPPVRAVAPLIASTAASVLSEEQVCWEELSIRLAARVVSVAAGEPAGYSAPRNAEARVTHIVRAIERHPTDSLSLRSMASAAGLSPYHFLRTFQRLTGITPHQYIVRARLREAAIRLSSRPIKVVDVALDSGFGDLSNFNRAFKAEFGVSPRAYFSSTSASRMKAPDLDRKARPQRSSPIVDSRSNYVSK